MRKTYFQTEPEYTPPVQSQILNRLLRHRKYPDKATAYRAQRVLFLALDTITRAVLSEHIPIHAIEVSEFEPNMLIVTLRLYDPISGKCCYHNTRLSFEVLHHLDVVKDALVDAHWRLKEYFVREPHEERRKCEQWLLMNRKDMEPSR